MNIGIIGCGWLGKPLALELSKEHHVECFDKEKTTNDSSFWNNDTIIIAINTKNNYLQSLEIFSKLAKKSANFILLSSTSVYREFDREVDEDIKISKPFLQKNAEDLVSSLRQNLLILRLGGLMGNDRVAGRWKKVSVFKDGPVNYIHSDDVINIIKEFLHVEIKDGIFNLVAPEHPLRSLVHETNAKIFDFKLGTFEDSTCRIVNSDKIIKTLNYKFLYPNPLKFYN